MGRWEPDARGRLAQAALELYGERGFEGVTVAEIADRAGLTERTFFRHFADKREVLFAGAGEVEEALARGVAGAAGTASALAAAGAGFEAVAAGIQEQRGRDFARARGRVIGASAELRERELAKLASWAEVVARALRDRGVDELDARLAADAGLAAFRAAFARWTEGPAGPSLPELVRSSLDRLGSLATAAQATR